LVNNPVGYSTAKSTDPKSQTLHTQIKRLEYGLKISDETKTKLGNA
jgi:hypothetical protein